ncbi:MAG TPA: hypothetical protein PK280_16140 [Planctomycetota bacterium]|nr:hypothetical protein [Planctomycetota bacterium]
MGDEQQAGRQGSWRATIIWSVVLAAVAFGAVLAATSWRTFHLAYCQRMMASKSEERQLDGIAKAAATHLRTGLTRREVETIFSPVRFDGPMDGSSSDMKKSKDGTGFYLAHPVSLGDGIALVFDQDDKLVRWWTVP